MKLTQVFKKKKIFILISIILFLIVVAMTYLWINFQNESNNNQEDQLQETQEINLDIEKNEKQNIDEKVKPEEFEIAAWLPSWAGEKGIDSLKNNSQNIDIISPVWYGVNEDGSLKNISKNFDKIKDIAKHNDMKLIPTISMFDHELFTKVLQNQENLDRHIDQIYMEVKENNYDGIDLNYESTKLSDKDKFFEVLKRLSEKLNQDNKIFIFTALAKWGDTFNYKSLKETRKVQDFSEMIKYVDYIRIMAYDYTSPKALNPGPIGPLNWIEKVLEYTIKQIPRNKIILGLHLYSYEWYMNAQKYDQKKQEQQIDPLKLIEISDFNLPLNNSSARSYTYETSKKLVQGFKGEKSDFEGEKIFKFRKVNPQTNIMEQRVLVYIDEEGVKKRVDLAKHYGIKGVVFWRLGGDDNLINEL